MTQKTRSYSSWRADKLSDPERAARYLNAALNESKEAFSMLLQMSFRRTKSPQLLRKLA